MLQKIITGSAAVLLLTTAIIASVQLKGAYAQNTNLIPNHSVEQGSGNAATNWSRGSWGANTSEYSMKTDAVDGSRSAYVSVSNYSSGDAKWMHAPTNVTPGTEYSFSNWYKSNVPTELVLQFQKTDGSMQYAWVKTVPASSDWKQTSASFTAPANTTKATMFHLIARNGWLQTDNYSLSGPEQGEPESEPQKAFSRPLVSLEFDDGWTSAYENGLPLVESFGWKPTQYIITQTAINNSNYGGLYMTADQIKDWNNRGDIGSHSVSHPDLPTLSQSEIQRELHDSKNYLDNLLGEPTKLYVSPYCSSSSTVVSIAKTLYQNVRNCDSPLNTKANFDRWNIKSLIILDTTTDAELRQQLNAAKANNGWLIVVWHLVDESGDRYSVSPSTLQRQLQIIKDSGITVTTTQKALDESLNN